MILGEVRGFDSQCRKYSKRCRVFATSPMYDSAKKHRLLRIQNIIAKTRGDQKLPIDVAITYDTGCSRLLRKLLLLTDMLAKLLLINLAARFTFEEHLRTSGELLEACASAQVCRPCFCSSSAWCAILETRNAKESIVVLFLAL